MKYRIHQARVLGRLAGETYLRALAYDGRRPSKSAAAEWAKAQQLNDEKLRIAFVEGFLSLDKFKEDNDGT